MKDIAKITHTFKDAINKNAARSKATKTRGQIDKAWKKSKDNYSKLKTQYDKLKKEADKINARLEATQELLTKAKQEMLNHYQTKQYIDLTGASSVVLYDDDVGYIIGPSKEEYHLNLSDDGELLQEPMKEYRKKSKKSTEESDDANDADDMPSAELRHLNFRLLE